MGLTNLSFHQNQLTRVPRPLKTDLIHLDLSFNALTEFPSHVLDLTHLKLLNLTGNPLDTLELSASVYDRLLHERPDLTMAFEAQPVRCRDGFQLKQYRPSLAFCVQGRDEQTMTLALCLIGGAIFILLLGGFCYYRRRTPQPDVEMEKPMVSPLRPWETDATLVGLRVDMSALSLIKRIGAGARVVVYYGTYQGQPVAVKKMLADHPVKMDGFAAEIQQFGLYFHPKIVAFFGVAWSRDDQVQMCAMTEFMDCGDLRRVLDSSMEMSWERVKYAIATNIVDALRYIHSLKLIHQDMKSTSVLVDSRAGAKLNGFGDGPSRRFTTRTKAVRWMAPEVLRGDTYDESADIYSFGVILNELDTRQVPLVNSTDAALLQHVSAHGYHPRLTFSCKCPSIVYSIAQNCLNPNPALRPSADKVWFALKRFGAED